jgi:hypothetical protein
MTKVKIAIAAFILIIVGIGMGIDWSDNNSRTRALWQQVVNPGKLSQSHAFLSNNCVACHAPVKGVEPALCISCHADNTALLQRQTTAFHANVQVCSGCHVEHQGSARMPTTMDHALLAKVGSRELNVSDLSANNSNTALSVQDVETAVKLMDQVPAREKKAPMLQPDNPAIKAEECIGAECAPNRVVTAQLSGARELPSNHPLFKTNESNLNCASCHATKDRHLGFFGTDCVQCHVTKQWTVPDFRHPSVQSTQCAQCHKPPPSHNMMHFPMMSAPLAGQPSAKVNQCYLCHQSTSWNDIKGKGWIKHH